MVNTRMQKKNPKRGHFIQKTSFGVSKLKKRTVQVRLSLLLSKSHIAAAHIVNVQAIHDETHNY